MAKDLFDMMVDYWHADTDENDNAKRDRLAKAILKGHCITGGEFKKYGLKALECFAEELEENAGSVSDQTMREITLAWMQTLDEIAEDFEEDLEEDFGYLFED